MKLHLQFYLLFSIVTIQINAQVNDLKTTQLRQKTFDIVWTTINNEYYDPTFDGVDWKKTKEIYLPKAISAKTDDAFHLVLNQMVDELKKSHLAVLSRNQIAQNNICSEGNIGVELKIIDDQAIIYQIKSNSVAEKSGLKIGFVIYQIGTETVSEIAQKIKVAVDNKQISESLKQRAFELSVHRRLCGKAKSIVKIVALDENSVQKTFELIREEPQIVEKGGLIKNELNYVSKKLENNIGYIKFNSWELSLRDSIARSISDFRQTKGIIIDLRGNRGGKSMLYKNVAGYFFTKKVSLGTYKTRFDQSDEFVEPNQAEFKTEGGKINFKPVPFHYEGKLMILVDYGSASASEVFSSGMRENRRAKIIGERTMGAVLAVIYKNLPTGGILSYPIAEYKTPNQFVLEGHGVDPDLKINLTRESLLQGRDLQIEAAITEIIGKSENLSQ